MKDFILKLRDIIAYRFGVLDSAYVSDNLDDLSLDIEAELGNFFDIRYVLISAENGQLYSTTLYEDEADATKAAGDRCTIAMLLAESLEPAPRNIAIHDVLHEAQEAFWDAVVKRFPDAKFGDLSPVSAVALDEAEQAAIEEWVRNNVPPKAA